jgi:hypothetical protein
MSILSGNRTAVRLSVEDYGPFIKGAHGNAAPKARRGVEGNGCGSQLGRERVDVEVLGLGEVLM